MGGATVEEVEAINELEACSELSAAAADAEWERTHPRKPHFWNRKRDGD